MSSGHDNHGLAATATTFPLFLPAPVSIILSLLEAARRCLRPSAPPPAR